MPLTPVDVTAACLVGVVCLVALGVFMPATGAREAARLAAWDRFDTLVRMRRLGSFERELLARWAHAVVPNRPFDAVARRRTFDRFAASEVERLAGAPGPTRAAHLARIATLRARLGFGTAPGPAQSTHDLRPGEPLELRLEGGERVDLRVVVVDEGAIHTACVGPIPIDLGPGWVTFAREDGSYRFRCDATRAGRHVRLGHGGFLIHEERRRNPRVAVEARPFWAAVERLPDGAAPEDPEGVELELIDVSLGGAALLADRAIRRGSVLWLDLPLGDGTDGPKLRGLRLTILASGFREGGGERPHFVHGTFAELEGIQRRVLSAYIDGRLSKAS